MPHSLRYSPTSAINCYTALSYLELIQIIRSIDPDNLIIVGSPEWSQRVDLVAEDPITTSENIAYTLHFYTLYH